MNSFIQHCSDELIADDIYREVGDKYYPIADLRISERSSFSGRTSEISGEQRRFSDFSQPSFEGQTSFVPRDRKFSDNNITEAISHLTTTSISQRNRRLKLQAITLTLAIIRFFMLGTLELNNQINKVTGRQSGNAILVSAFSYLIFGQVIDNQTQANQRTIFCAVEFALGCWFFVLSGVSFFDATFDLTQGQLSINYLLQPMSFFLSCAFQITITLQLFNWFGKRNLGTVLGVWLASQLFGVMAKFLVLGIWEYFPNFQQAESAPNGQSVITKYAYLQIVVASFFIVFSIIDYWFFIFHPFEAAIVVDIEEKTYNERVMLRSLQKDAAYEKKNIFKCHQIVRRQNSYVKVVNVLEYQRLCMVAVIQQTANQILQLVLVSKSDFIQGKSSRDCMVYASTLAFLTLGFYTDFIARGRNLYTLLFAFILTQFVISLVLSVLDYSFKADVNSTVFLYVEVSLFSYAATLATVLQLQSIPLYIAGRYRDMNSAWELPLAGQMLAIMQIVALVLPSIIAPAMFILMPTTVGRKSLALGMLVISVLPLVKLVQFEAAVRRLEKRHDSNESVGFFPSQEDKDVILVSQLNVNMMQQRRLD